MAQSLPANAGDASSIPGSGTKTPTCHRATEPLSHSKRSHGSEKPVCQSTHCGYREPPQSNEDPVQPKILKQINFKKKFKKNRSKMGDRGEIRHQQKPPGWSGEIRWNLGDKTSSNFCVLPIFTCLSGPVCRDLALG